jgi:hypothetical protein
MLTSVDTSERPFACPQCKRAFLRKYSPLEVWLTCRDVLARHKRLVHTRPEDREPPKKRGRPPKSSYANANNDANKTTPSTATQNGTPAAQNVAEPVWPDVVPNATPATPFPFTNGDSQNQSFLTNPFLDNFMFGSLDTTLEEINFAEQDILSFLKPDSTRYGRPPSLNSLNSLNGNPIGTPDTKPVILQPDFVDWLQMNRDDYMFSMHHSSPRGLEGVSTSPAPDLIEATDSKDIPLVNPAKPFTLVLIDEPTYAEISNSLKTTYKVRNSCTRLILGHRCPRFCSPLSTSLGTIHFIVL